MLMQKERLLLKRMESGELKMKYIPKFKVGDTVKTPKGSLGRVQMVSGHDKNIMYMCLVGEDLNWWLEKYLTKVECKDTTVTKPTNPKDALGITKSPVSCIPQRVLSLQGLAHLEGALKYGNHNWRKAGVNSSVYFDAANRHLKQWYEGEDIDKDSGLPHIVKAIAGLNILLDAILSGNINDDRPKKVHEDWMEEHNALAKNLIEKYNVH